MGYRARFTLLAPLVGLAMLHVVVPAAAEEPAQPQPAQPQPPPAPPPPTAAQPAATPHVPSRRPPPQPRYPYPPYPTPYGYRPYAPAPYPAPQPPKPQPPRVLPDWDPDTPVPDGYRLDSSPHSGMLAAGITLLAAGWVSSAAATPVLARDEDDQGIDGDGIEGKDWLPLLIPVAGPFVSIDSVKASPAATALLAIDGAVQSVGLVLLVSGIFVKRHRAVRVPVVSFVVEPYVGVTSRGLGVSGVF